MDRQPLLARQHSNPKNGNDDYYHLKKYTLCVCLFEFPVKTEGFSTLLGGTQNIFALYIRIKCFIKIYADKTIHTAN
jgi:hypothetical protein